MDIRSRFDRQQKSDASGYRMLGLGIVGVIAQILLIFLASQLPGLGVYYASIVNLCSFLGLLALSGFFLYRHGFLPIRQWTPYYRPYLWNLSHRLPPRRIFVQHTRGPKDACIAAPAYSIVPSDATLHQLKIAVETMRLGVTITDIQGKILYTNPAEARMHGYCVEELLGKDLGILAPAELRNPMTPDQISQMKGLRESVNIRKNGSRFPVQLLSDVIRDDYARPIAVVTTCEDITERKRLEKLMKQRTRELALLNRMSDVLQACRNEHDTYHVIREICQKLFPLESGCLCMMDSTEPYLKVVEFWGTPPHNSFVPSQTGVSCSDDISRPGNLCPYQNVCTEQDCL
jgi:PAS domain S-box-containing protein